MQWLDEYQLKRIIEYTSKRMHECTTGYRRWRLLRERLRGRLRVDAVAGEACRAFV